MGKLKVLASGNSPQAQAQARGKLFEKLMVEVLRHYGYSIDHIPSVNYAGMEIDIEGKATVTGIPLYAECKCYEMEVDSTKLQTFYGKYMARWLKDKRCQGLFVALPGINSHARGFYQDNCEGNTEITVRLYEEKDVLNTIFDTCDVVRPEIISKCVTPRVGTPGDWLLLYTEKGLFWVQYVIPPGEGIPTRIALMNAQGILLSDGTTIDYIMQLYPELGDFDKIISDDANTLQPLSVHQGVEEIVEVRGSSACFEYQFPASPEYFIGRQLVLQELDSFTTMILNRETSSRGILFEANSGWGKSSLVLASVARLKEIGHLAVAIDSRSASSSQFILRAVDYALGKFADSGGPPFERRTKAITGFEGAVKALLNYGQVLERNRKIIFIFLDQFENIFSLPDVLKGIRDIFLKVCDAQTNVVFGFSWKSDLIGLTTEFPYQLRDAITGSSRRITLNTFSDVETTALLDKLSDELRAPLRKDLRFFLSEFSQGYPWLLKKLCAHVKAQREARVPQSDIANSLLNVEELFQEDLRSLTTEEEDALRRIAKAAPIGVLDLGDEFRPEVVQSLVNTRLVVRIGNKYDVYWDIFRDYLNAGRVPFQGNYVLRTHLNSVLKATKLLSEVNNTLDISKFQEQTGLSAKSFYNVARELRLLGLAKVKDGKVILQIKLPTEEKGFDASLRVHLRERLRSNRLVGRLIEKLDAKGSLTNEEVSKQLAESCPYVSATEHTWRTYARRFAEWIDFVDLAIFDNNSGTLTRYTPGTEIRERQHLMARRRAAIAAPLIQYTPVEKVAIRLIKAMKEGKSVDWTGLKKSTIAKALATLEDLGFISRKPRSITVQYKTWEFVSKPENRPGIFQKSALKMKSFATFIDILRAHKDTGRTLTQLAVELREKLSTDWKDGTAETNVKIMLDWARHTKLAPGVFAEARRGPRRSWKKEE